MENNEIVRIKAILGNRDVPIDLVQTYYEDMSSIAYDMLKESTDYSKAIVRECVVELINRRGDEGISSASGGSQNYSYEDAIKNLKQRLLSHRKGLKTL